MASRIHNPLEKYRPAFTFDLAKINFPIACESDLAGNFDYVLQQREEKKSIVLRSFLYKYVGGNEKEFSKAIKNFIFTALEVKDREFSEFMRRQMAEYILKYHDNPETKKSMKAFLKKVNNRGKHT